MIKYNQLRLIIFLSKRDSLLQNLLIIDNLKETKNISFNKIIFLIITERDY